MSSAQDVRRERHQRVAARLAALSDGELSALLAAGHRGESVHGGQTGVLELEGMQVFVKAIALSEIERERSTANVFGLPLFYQYGVGSAGFGAWRELEASLKASDWALEGECPYFPIIHHWRVLPRTPPALTDQQREWLERAVPYWNGSEAVGGRLAAIAGATQSVVVIMEHAPDTLFTWGQKAVERRDPDAAQNALRFCEQLHEAAAFMNARGMLHFDLHAWNILTDGDQIFAADFGLTICSDFELSAEEHAFFEGHRLYDRAYVYWALAAWLSPQEGAPALPPALAAIVEDYAPVSSAIAPFFAALRDNKLTPYPAAALEEALDRVSN